jgi:electron transport complex protein RnfG
MAGRLRILTEAWLILALAAFFGAALAAVHAGLSDRIEANKRAETLRQVPALVLGSDVVQGAAIAISGDSIRIGNPDGGMISLDIVEREIGGHKVLEARSHAGGELAGWVVHGSDQGYADVIELLIGLTPDGSVITGLFVLSQKETPALGDGITKDDFRNRFVGRETNSPLTASRTADGTGIRAITAATISSRSVCDIVNEAVSDVKPLLGKEAGS